MRIMMEESEQQRRELVAERERQENASPHQRRGVSAMRDEQKEDDWETKQEGYWICDRMGHTWFFCTHKKTGPGCARCGSTSHQLINCPQRPRKGTKPPGRRVERRRPSADHQVSMVATKVLGVEGAPQGARLLHYAVRMGKKEVHVLLDSGASVNCIDEEVLNKVGGVISRQAPGKLLYLDSREAEVVGIAEVETKGRGYKENVEFWVIKGLGVTALLGSPWL